MAKAEYDEVRENRITMDIVVDIYEPEEILLGWYYYLERTLNFPFPAQWKSSSRSKKVDLVEVVGMSSE